MTRKLPLHWLLILGWEQKANLTSTQIGYNQKVRTTPTRKVTSGKTKENYGYRLLTTTHGNPVCMGGSYMSHLEIIDKLCEMLDLSQNIIRMQESLLEQHGIETDTGGLEERRNALLQQIEDTI